MTRTALPLGVLTRGELEFLRKAIARRQVPTPLTRVALESCGKGGLFARLGPLAGAGEEMALALLELALAVDDRDGAVAAAAPAVLAWTWPDVTQLQGGVRATTAVVLELLGAARERVVIAGYEFDHGAVIFQPLHLAMVERGVKVSVFLDVRSAPSPRSNLDAYRAVQVQQFLGENWPFGPPWPTLYHWPAGAAHGSRGSLHAKCVVVDGRSVLIGSANFTRRGHKRNLEIGVRLDDAAVAQALVAQLDRLVEKGELVELPTAAVAGAAPPTTAEAEDDEGDGPSVVPAAGRARAIAAEALAKELLVSGAARALFVQVVASGLPTPRVGEDVEGPGGEVIGSPELAWEAPRVAVLLPAQEGSRKRLEAAGWTCLALDGEDALDRAAFVALVELMRRGG